MKEMQRLEPYRISRQDITDEYFQFIARMREKLALEARNEAEVRTQTLFGPPYAFQFAVASVADESNKREVSGDDANECGDYIFMQAQ